MVPKSYEVWKFVDEPFKAGTAGTAAAQSRPVELSPAAEAEELSQLVAKAEATVAQRRAAGQPSSPHVGVSWLKRERRWLAQIRHQGQQQHLGRFSEEEAAAQAVDDATNKLKGNQAGNEGGKAAPSTLGKGACEHCGGPKRGSGVGYCPNAECRAEALVARRRAAGLLSSPFVGVTWAKSVRRWGAQIVHDGQTQHLGSFYMREEEAARAFDAKARELRGDKAHGGRKQAGGFWRLNFPTEAEAAAAPDGLQGCV